MLAVLSGAARRAGGRRACRRRCRPSAAAGRGWRVRCGRWRELLRDRAFLGYALAGGLAFGALFAYISGSSFVLQGIYGALAAALQRAVRGQRARADRGQPGQRAARRAASARARLLRGGLPAIAASGDRAARVVVLIGGLRRRRRPGRRCSSIVSSLSFVLPNATALALADHARWRAPPRRCSASPVPDRRARRAAGRRGGHRQRGADGRRDGHASPRRARGAPRRGPAARWRPRDDARHDLRLLRRRRQPGRAGARRAARRAAARPPAGARPATEEVERAAGGPAAAALAARLAGRWPGARRRA